LKKNQNELKCINFIIKTDLNYEYFWGGAIIDKRFGGDGGCGSGMRIIILIFSKINKNLAIFCR
jgi:hypothetical protein